MLFGKARSNLCKNILHPQKYALPYTYAIGNGHATENDHNRISPSNHVMQTLPLSVLSSDRSRKQGGRKGVESPLKVFSPPWKYVLDIV